MSELKRRIKAFQLRVEEPRNERETYPANFVQYLCLGER